MKNKIESRHCKYNTERSSSSSSTEVKRDRKFEIKKECDEKSRSKAHSKDYHRKRRSRGFSSSSESDDEANEESSSSYRKYSSRRDNYVKNENLRETVKIKEEPVSDYEDQRYSKYNRNSRKNGKRNDDFRERKRSRSRSRSWNNDRRPVKQERFSDGNYQKQHVKKERFTDNEKEPQWGKQNEQLSGQDKKKPMVDKAKPDFGLSGKLAEETNTYNGVVIKYSEPPEARKPKRRWRLYPFKGDEGLPTLYIHRQSAFLIGRDRKVADLPVDHPSCSKQHAVLQYRLVPFERSNGSTAKRICPYIIDLESANGTFVNNKKIEPRKYVELLEKDVLKFAFSSREYVLLHEHSKDSGEDDDI